MHIQRGQMASAESVYQNALAFTKSMDSGTVGELKHILTMMLKAYCDQGASEQALDVFEVMMSTGVMRDIMHYRMLFGVLDIAKRVEMYQRAITDGVFPAPNEQALQAVDLRNLSGAESVAYFILHIDMLQKHRTTDESFQLTDLRIVMSSGDNHKQLHEFVSKFPITIQSRGDVSVGVFAKTDLEKLLRRWTTKREQLLKPARRKKTAK